MIPISSAVSQPNPPPAARAAERPDPPAAPSEPRRSQRPARDEYVPEKRAPEERCTANTDEVDQELKRLRERREELTRRLSSETDEARARALERELAQVERQLSQKDNDSYRRRHTKFTDES